MESLQNNIWPSHIERILFHRSDSIIDILKIQAIRICQGIVVEEYIQYAFKKFSHGYYYKDSENNILGFCIWKKKKQHLVNNNTYKYAKVLLICAEENKYKLGKNMLFDIETNALKNKVDAIELEAASESLIPYYKGFGYFLQRENVFPREAPHYMYKLLNHSEPSS